MLDPMTLARALPGACAQGIIWGIMALGVYLTFKILDVADLTVDGSIATGGAVAVMLVLGGVDPTVAVLVSIAVGVIVCCAVGGILVIVLRGIGVGEKVSMVAAAVVGVAAGIVAGTVLHGFLVDGGLSPAVTLVVSFLVGAMAGLITGVLHIFLGIPAILASILTQISLYSINLNIMGKSNQPISVDKYPLVVSLRYIPKAIFVSLIFAAILIAILYWYFGTEQGCSIRATGCNLAMARAQGVNTGFVTILMLALSNGLVGLSGGLLTQYQGFADINMGRGAIVIGLAAVIIGEVIGEALLGKHLNFLGRLIFVVIGGIIYYIVLQIVYWLRLPTDDSKLFTAIIVGAFLAVPYLKGKYFAKPKLQKEGSKHA